MKYNVIINPFSGRGESTTVWRKLASIFHNSGVSTDVHTTNSGDISPYLSRCDGIIAVGGDGTYHNIVNQMMQSQNRIPLGLIPAGTGNALMTDLGYSNPEDAARKIVQGHRRQIDVLEVTTPNEIIYTLSVVGWGMFAAANQTAEKLRCLRGMRYNIAALWHIVFKRTYPAMLKYDKIEDQAEFITVFASNTIHTGRAIKAAPKAKIDDGLMDVVMIKDENRLTLLKLFRRFVTGRYLDHKQVTYQQLSDFQLQTGVHQTLDIDGEMKGSSPFSVRVIPKAVELLL